MREAGRRTEETGRPAGPSVLVVGDLNVDVLLPVDAYPEPGGDQRAKSMEVRAGGSAANTAAVLAGLGIPTSLLARVGDDTWADVAIDAMRRSGVGVEHVRRLPGESSGLMFVPVTPDGERTLFGHRGANRRLEPGEISAELLAGVGGVHLSGYALWEEPQASAVERLVELAAERGIWISLDSAREPALFSTDRLRALLPRLSLLVTGREAGAALAEEELAPAEEEPALAEEQPAPVPAGGCGTEGSRGADLARSLLEMGPARVAHTLGAGGAVLADADGVRSLPPVAEDALDTTGAGDALAAGLLYGLVRGLDAEAAAALASALAALAVGRPGGGAGDPRTGDVPALLRSRISRARDEESRRIFARALEALARDGGGSAGPESGR